MAVQKKYPALGRGLDALISTGEVHTNGSSSIGEVEIQLIRVENLTKRHSRNWPKASDRSA